MRLHSYLKDINLYAGFINMDTEITSNRSMRMLLSCSHTWSSVMLIFIIHVAQCVGFG